MKILKPGGLVPTFNPLIFLLGFLFLFIESGPLLGQSTCMDIPYSNVYQTPSPSTDPVHIRLHIFYIRHSDGSGGSKRSKSYK